MSTSEIVQRLLTAPGPLSTEDRRAAAARLDELERERQEISMALGNQREEVISTTELVENIERITRIAGKGVLRIGELERENARLREALFETHLDLVAYADIDVARKRLVKRRAALAGSGEK
jgi:hypothetical protein